MMLMVTFDVDNVNGKYKPKCLMLIGVDDGNRSC